MKSKFLNAEFGYCPRVLCDRQIVLPIAMSEDLSISRVKVYCPKCGRETSFLVKHKMCDNCYQKQQKSLIKFYLTKPLSGAFDYLFDPFVNFHNHLPFFFLFFPLTGLRITAESLNTPNVIRSISIMLIGVQAFIRRFFSEK